MGQTKYDAGGFECTIRNRFSKNRRGWIVRSKLVLLQFMMISGKHSILTTTNVQVFGAFCWSLRCRVFASRYNTICLFLPLYPITLFTFRQAHMEQSFYNVWCKQTSSTGFCLESMCAQDWLLFPRQRLFSVWMSQWTIIRIIVSFFILNPHPKIMWRRKMDTDQWQILWIILFQYQGGNFGSVAKNPMAKNNCLI